MLLFLGSGVSVASGLPSVGEVTEHVLGKSQSLNDFGSEDSVSFELNTAIGKDITSRAQSLLNLLYNIDIESRKSMASYWSGKEYKHTGAIYRTKTTYEDLFYLCEQIYWNGEALVDEAPVTAFVNTVEQQAGQVLLGNNRDSRLIDLYALSKQASHLIEFVVDRSLRCDRPVCLDAIPELAAEWPLDMVTLNHDTLVEQVLNNSEVSFFDGFGVLDGDIRWWQNNSTKAHDKQLQIIKLHGSINWRRVSLHGRVAVVQVSDLDAEKWKNQSGEFVNQHINGAYVLSGSNKIISYNGGIFAEMFFRFHSALGKNNYMIMSGYGWGDIGINLRIESWLDHSPKRRLYLFHREPESLLNRSPELDRSYRHWVDTGKLILVRQWLGDMSANELIELIKSFYSLK